MMRGREVNWGAMPLSGVFETTDSALVMVGAFKQHPLRDIATALELPALADDPRFANHAQQVENKPALQAIFRARYKEQHDGALAGAPGSPGPAVRAGARRCADALADEQATINGIKLEGPAKSSRCALSDRPMHMSDAPVEIRIAPPSLGRHTDEVLAELGLLETAAE